MVKTSAGDLPGVLLACLPPAHNVSRKHWRCTRVGQLLDASAWRT